MSVWSVSATQRHMRPMLWSHTVDCLDQTMNQWPLAMSTGTQRGRDPNNNQTHTHTHPFNGPLSGTTQVSRYQKGKTNLDFTEARDSEWQWHQLGYMQVCTLLQSDNHASTPPLNFLQAGCPSCRPTNSVKALKVEQQPDSSVNFYIVNYDQLTMLPSAFSALTLLVGCQEEHPACKNWVMRCWCGYLSGARCRLFAYGPADATAITKHHHLLSQLNLDWFCISGAGLPRLSWKRGR